MYHNDQWYRFTLIEKQVLYLNITAQQCQKNCGIQLVLLEGNPCVTSTYKVWKCISKLPLHDTYIRLDSLQPEVDYLLNIDGFLADVCSFEISVSNRPKGYPVLDNSAASIQKVVTEKQNVKVSWEIKEADAELIHGFKVMRSSKQRIHKLCKG